MGVSGRPVSDGRSQDDSNRLLTGDKRGGWPVHERRVKQVGSLEGVRVSGTSHVTTTPLRHGTLGFEKFFILSYPIYVHTYDPKFCCL